MKLILSRKGFDSANGGVPSPILPDGRLCWLPIPDSSSKIHYDNLTTGGQPLGEVVEQVTKGEIDGKHGTHLDPDLDAEVLPRKQGWRGLFGQAGAAQSHLANKGLGPGDLFLFFGWFRQTELVSGKLKFVPDARHLHVIFGWLQVGWVEPVIGFRRDWLGWAGYHPHLHRGGGNGEAVYVAAPKLKLGCLTGVAGSGMFDRLRPELVLTEKGRTRSHWRLPGWFYPAKPELALSYHGDMKRWRRGRGCCYLHSVAKGQEFVMDCGDGRETLSWLRDVLRRG